MAYHFDTQLASGQDDEAVLDAFFARFYEIEPASMELQRIGIDRLFTARSNGIRKSVEYKSDVTAGRTGNAFIETVSVDTAGKKGWALTCCAQYLVYYIPPTGVAYVFPVTLIKEQLPRWLAEPERYPVREIPNVRNGQAYKTHGLLVRLSELEPWAIYTQNIRAA